MNSREIVRDYYGKMLGSITTDSQGNKVVRDLYGKILGKYDKKSDVTRDFYGRLIARGDRSNALIPTKPRQS